MRAFALALALLCGLAYAQDVDCAATLDGGVEPPPAVKVLPGTVLDKPAWLLTPERMCRVGDALQRCQATTDAKPTWLVVTAAVLGVVVGGAVVAGALSASGHLK